MRFGHYNCSLLVIMLSNSCISSDVNGQESDTSPSEESNNFYRNPEERREAGLGTSVTDWLAISGLLELERQQTRSTITNGSSSTERGILVKTIQIGFDFKFTEDIEAELVIEAEDEDKSRFIIDEVSISWDWQKLGITLGRYSPNFGEYYSHLITGPMLEFGETRANTVSVDYSFSDQFQVELFWLESEVDQTNHAKSFDWGLMLEWESEDESIRLGASYLSDIGESDERFFEDFNNTYQQRTAAFSAFALLGFEQFEITAEMVKTLESIIEIDSQYNQPEAYNLELAFFPSPVWQLALRYETSRRLEDNPDTRYGFGLRWQLHSNINIAADYLYAKYPTSNDQVLLQSEEYEEAIIDEQLIAVQVSIEF